MESPLAECAKGGHFHVVTPLLESWALSQVAGTTVFLKCENVQPAGSFKIRGIGHFCQEVRVCGQEGRREVVPEGGEGGGVGTGGGSVTPALNPIPSLPRRPRRDADGWCALQVTPHLSALGGPPGLGVGEELTGAATDIQGSASSQGSSLSRSWSDGHLYVLSQPCSHHQ